MPNTADLLEEIAALKAMLIAADARDLRKDERIERLEKLVAAFKHAAFGRRSEKSDLLPGNRLPANDERAEQFELALEDLETAIAAIHAEEDAEDRAAKRPAKQRATNRGALPKHLARIEEVIEPASLTCACGGCLHCIGEDVSERLDIIPAQFRVIRCPAAHVYKRERGDPPPKIRLSILHGWRGPSPRTGAADPRRHADRSDGGPCSPSRRCRHRLPGSGSVNMPTTCPCIAKLRSTAARVLISIVPPLQIGWAAPLLSCALSSTP
jgi:hypothetical protein